MTTDHRPRFAICHVGLTADDPSRLDDLGDAHELFERLGAIPTQVVPGSPHDTFTATDPEGNALLIESSHVSGAV